MTDTATAGFPCDSCDFVAKTEPGLARHVTVKHEGGGRASAQRQSEEPSLFGDGSTETGDLYAGESAAEEAKPEPKKAKRFWERTTKPRAERAPTPPKEKAPSVVRGRVRLEEFGTGLWKGLAWGAAQGGYTAAARALTLQADAAGPAFDRMVKGTMLDRWIQPLARIGENGKDLAALAALPAAAEAYARNPTVTYENGMVGANPITTQAFRAALIGALPQIAKARKETVKRYQKLEADLASMAEVFGKPPGSSVSLDEVASWIIFGSTEPPAEPEPERETADSFAA